MAMLGQVARTSALGVAGRRYATAMGIDPHLS
jgi:hypothetical protein